MIITSQVEIPKTQELTSSYIEKELSKIGIDPLRWTIVDVLQDRYILSVSYDKK